MKDVNKIILMGRLGADPIQRSTQKGLTVVNFSLATARRLADSDPDSTTPPKEETQWHKIVVWGKQAENCKQYLNKGSSVFLEGMVRSRKYTGKDGESHIAFEVHAENVVFLSGRRRSDDGATGAASIDGAFSDNASRGLGVEMSVSA